jgi:hypothetical protein
MLVYKKQISESFSGNMRNPINPATYHPSTIKDEPMNRPNEYVRNESARLLEPLGDDGIARQNRNPYDDTETFGGDGMNDGSLLGSSGMYGE